MRENVVATGVAERPVAQIMSRPVIAVRDVDTLDRGLQVLAIADLHHIAVVDAEGRYVGLLSDRTVAAAWLHYPIEFSRLRAIDIADPPSQPTVTASATIRQAAVVMHDCVTDAVVVIDPERRPVGVVTAADLVTLIAAGDPEIVDDSEIVGDPEIADDPEVAGDSAMEDSEVAGDPGIPGDPEVVRDWAIEDSEVAGDPGIPGDPEFVGDSAMEDSEVAAAR